MAISITISQTAYHPQLSGRPAQPPHCSPGQGLAAIAGGEGAGAGRAQAEFAQDVVEGAGVCLGIGPV